MAKRTQRHTDTEIPLKGFEATLQTGFDWAGEHPREVLAVIGAIVLGGALIAGVYEWQQRSRDSAARALEQIEQQFAGSMGADPRVALVPEPGDPEQARQSRERALTELVAFIEDRGSSRAAEFATVRAAEMEADLGRFEEAQWRLEELVDDLDPSDPIRAVALRLLGYVLEEQQLDLEAGEAYAAAAAIESYPDPADLWLGAGDAYRRGGDAERAAEAYRKALGADPVWATRKGVEDLLGPLDAEPSAEEEPAPEEPTP